MLAADFAGSNFVDILVVPSLAIVGVFIAVVAFLLLDRRILGVGLLPLCIFLAAFFLDGYLLLDLGLALAVVAAICGFVFAVIGFSFRVPKISKAGYSLLAASALNYIGLELLVTLVWSSL